MSPHLATTTSAPDVGAALMLDAIGKTLGPLVVVRPEVQDGRVIEAEVVWITQAATDRTGLSAGSRVTDAYGPDLVGLPPTVATEAALRSPGTALVLGPYEATRAGETRTYEISAVSHHDLVVLKFLDRTESLRDRHAAEASQQQFRDMLDGLEAGVVLLQPHFVDGVIDDAEIIWTNQASAGLWIDQAGLRPGTRVRQVYYDQEEWLVAANEAWTGATVTRMLRAQPDHTPWTAATEVLRRVGDSLLEFTHDRTNDQLLLDRLAAADHRFAALVEDLPLTVFVGQWGVDGLEFVSPNAARLLRRPLSKLQRISDLLLMIHPDDRPKLDAISGWVAGAGAGDHYVNEWRIIRGDGTEIVGAFRAVRRRNAAGADEFVAIVSDVTEHRRLLDEIEAGERLRALGRTAGSIAHDFNNLLMIVTGNVQQTLAGDPGNRRLQAAEAAATRAATLAQSMLAFARGTPGRPREVRIDALLRQFEPIVHASLPPDASLHMSLPWAVPVVLADATHVEQVLLNLVSNSRDALRPNGRLRISVDVTPGARCHLRDEPEAGGPYVAVCVEDNGAGVPKEILARVWEPYFSSKEHTREHGTGLGLSTVHGLAHQYGGHVHIESDPGHGTRVTVYFPVHTDA